jgi:hypothetical protein
LNSPLVNLKKLETTLGSSSPQKDSLIVIELKHKQ